MSGFDEQFGQRRVSSDERRKLIRRVFNDVAPRYDLMNDLMSFGIHRLWKHTFARRCGNAPENKCLAVELAGGTGAVARLLAKDGWDVIVCDPSIGMMQCGRQSDSAIRWLAGEAERLPFSDGSINLLTISFGIRNVTQLSSSIAEIRRVLAPGGRFMCLEFSRPAWWLAPIYDLYSRWVIPRLGAAVAGKPEAYQYLIDSIRQFPDQTRFATLIEDAGFKRVRWRNLSFGIACIHCAEQA